MKIKPLARFIVMMFAGDKADCSDAVAHSVDIVHDDCNMIKATGGGVIVLVRGQFAGLGHLKSKVVLIRPHMNRISNLARTATPADIPAKEITHPLRGRVGVGYGVIGMFKHCSPGGFLLLFM